MKYNGKSFDKSNNHDSSTTFGKDRFATYIVRENRKLSIFHYSNPYLIQLLKSKTFYQSTPIKVMVMKRDKNADVKRGLCSAQWSELPNCR